MQKENNHMNKWNRVLNIIMLTSIAVCITRIIVDYVYLNILRPDIYAMTSAPWYTAGLLCCAVTLPLLLICFVIKAVMKIRKSRKDA